jgi:HSP20 family protein
MPEVKVETPKTPAKKEAPVPVKYNDVFAPTLPFGRFFGMNPIALKPFANPWAMMREFTDEMDRMFTAGPMAEAWAPAVDVRRCNGDLVITAELPGLKKEDIKVEVTDTALVIEGERKLEHKEDHEGFHRLERSYGKFYRTVPLPEGAKTALAKAELTDGVLKIAIPVPAAKTPEEMTRARKVPIETGTTTAKAAKAAA